MEKPFTGSCNMMMRALSEVSITVATMLTPVDALSGVGVPVETWVVQNKRSRGQRS